MLRKLVVTVMALVGIGAVYAIDPGGHASTVAGYFKEWCKPSLDYEIRRAEKLIGKLDNAIKENQEFLARERVAIGKLEESTEQEKVAVQEKRKRVVALRKGVEEGEQAVSLAPAKRQTLPRELSQLKIMDRKLETTQKILEVRKQRYQYLRDKVDEMRASQDTANLKLEEMKQELAAVRLDEQHTQHYAVDDSTFKRVAELLDQIDTEVKTRRELVDMRRVTVETSVSTTDTSATVLDEVDAYLAGK